MSEYRHNKYSFDRAVCRRASARPSCKHWSMSMPDNASFISVPTGISPLDFPAKPERIRSGRNCNGSLATCCHPIFKYPGMLERFGVLKIKDAPEIAGL